MYIKEIGWEFVDWIHVAQDSDQWRAVVYTVMNIGVPKKAVNFLISWCTISFSSRTLLFGVGWLVGWLVI